MSTAKLEVEELAMAIHKVLDGKNYARAFLALLLNVDYAIDEMLERDPPQEIRERIRGLQSVVYAFVQSGRDTLFKEEVQAK